MTLVTSKGLLTQAQAGRYAIGAFNMNTLEQAQAIVAAAQDERAPVVIQVSHHALVHLGQGDTSLGLRYAAEIGRVAAASVDVPVVLHLDHGTYHETLQAAEVGFTSVMFDGGNLPLAENIARTRELCAAMRQAGLTCEAELGEVPRMDASGHAETGELTDPSAAADFVTQTGVDALAVAIGSIHAVKQKVVELDLARLAAIRACVAVPLVLHGSSGVTDVSIRSGIAAGLCKVNVGTQLSQAFTAAIRARLAEQPANVDPRDYLGAGRAATQERVRERLRFLGCTGKADAGPSR